MLVIGKRITREIIEALCGLAMCVFVTAAFLGLPVLLADHITYALLR